MFNDFALYNTTSVIPAKVLRSVASAENANCLKD